VQSDRTPGFVTLKELLPDDPCLLQVVSEHVCPYLERAAVLLDEHWRFPGRTGMVVSAPLGKCSHYARVQRPGPRVLRLVGVEADVATGKVHFVPGERESLP
jgi:hypothetical protein